MIVAVILANKAGGAQSYLAKTGEESAIEIVVGNVLRGPFGGTLVASMPDIAPTIKDALSGFAVKFVETPPLKDAEALSIEALKAAKNFRERWEKAMAAAAGRFSGGAEKAAPKSGGTDWSKHKQSADVKIRGLARSFDRDGVMLIPGDAIEVTKEKLAELVEKFAQLKEPARSLPDAKIPGLVMLSLDAANEGTGLKAGTNFTEWLKK